MAATRKVAECRSTNNGTHFKNILFRSDYQPTESRSFESQTRGSQEPPHRRTKRLGRLLEWG